MQHENIDNENVRASAGASTPKAQSQGQDPEVKEGNPDQQRPEYGSDGGANTSTREGQLPSLEEGGVEGADADTDESVDKDAEQQIGSDADEDRGGEPSISTD